MLQAGSYRADASVRACPQNLRRQLTGTGRTTAGSCAQKRSPILKERIGAIRRRDRPRRGRSGTRWATASPGSTGSRTPSRRRCSSLEHGVTGIAFNLEEDNVGAALFGEWELIKEGEPVKRTGQVASIPVGDQLLGRIVDPLGNPSTAVLRSRQRRPVRSSSRRPESSSASRSRSR